MARIGISVAAAFLPLLSLGVAVAQPTAGASASAESLFREAKELMEQGKVSEACGKFTASYDIEPMVGTLFNLANCHEQEGRTASAWAEFLRAASMARSQSQADREEIARGRARDLEPKLMRLRIEVPEAVRLAGLEVTLGSTPVEPAAWGSPIPVDPGEQVIRATAPGKEPREDRVTLTTEGATVVFELRPLNDAPTEPVVVPAPPREEPPAPPPPRSEPLGADSDPGRSQRTVGLVVGAIGAAGLATGAVFGALAKGDWEDAKAEGCASGACPTPSGQTASEGANDKALIGTIGVGAGGAFLIGGIILYLTAPSASDNTSATLYTTAGSDRFSFGYRGAF
jgi:hypothetical protein